MSKKEEAKQSKMIKQQNDAKKRHQHFKIEQENRMKNQIIKQQKHVANVKIEQDRNRRLYNVKKAHDEKVINEDLVRSQKEDEVMQMEKLEMELIKKLQNTIRIISASRYNSRFSHLLQHQVQRRKLSLR